VIGDRFHAKKVIDVLSSGYVFSILFALASYALFTPLWLAFSASSGNMVFMGKVIPWADEFPVVWSIVTRTYYLFTPATGYIVGWYLYHMLIQDVLCSAIEMPLLAEEVDILLCRGRRTSLS